MFNFNITRTIQRITPPFWRRDFLLAWVETLLLPVKTLNETFVAWVTEKRNELTYNGQTIHVERMLNDIFDPVDRRIAIEHSLDTREFDYFISEGQAADFDYLQSEVYTARYDYYRSERVVELVDGFRIRIPLALASFEDQIVGRVLRYKLAGIKYQTLLS